MSTLVQKPAVYKVIWPKTIERSASYVVAKLTPELKHERESTIRNKKLFLEILEKSRGVITTVCEKVDISRATYYHWRNTDPQFAENADLIIRAKPEILEDRMFALAMQGNVSALKYLLDHSKYPKQPKKESEVHIHHYVAKREPDPVKVTMEDVVDELFEKYKAFHEEDRAKDNTKDSLEK